ncbi:MAG: glucose-1-phosphate adenylyltransferase subunit GlgD [Bacillota bacterium]|nr:glucose-1-phosphate adenylyltransferase subunit GlgD [Bacillota bacterium]
MDNCFGLISYNNKDREFGSLSKSRPSYMLPYGGRYRLIDLTISNMVNNGIRSVALYTGEKIRSTMDHLADGKPWSLNSRFHGLFLYPPIKQSSLIERLGDIADFYSTLNFFKTLREDNALIVKSNVIFMKDLEDAYEKFVSSSSDIMLFYVRKNDEKQEFVNTNKLHLDDQGFVSNIGVNLGTEKSFNMYIDAMFIKKEVLISLVKETVEKGNANSLKDAIIKNKKSLIINSYELADPVYLINDTKSYYDANLDLLTKDIFNQMFIKNGKVMTKTKDEPSTIYRRNPDVENSLIANGCIIEGDVESSIIFRGVKIGKNAIVKNSIIMQKTEIKEGAVVINSIIDKYCVIEEDVSLVGSINQPAIIEKYGRVEKE